MVLIPCILLAVFPPGVLFPQMAARMSAPGRIGLRRKDGDKSDPEKQSQPEGQGSQTRVASGDESGVTEGHANKDASAEIRNGGTQ